MSFWLSVVVAAPAHSGIGGPLTYRSELPLAPGQLVRVPLGRREVLGVVWETLPDSGSLAPEHAKTVLGALDGLPPLNATWRRLVAFTAGYYQRSLGEVALAALPPQLRELTAVQLARRLKGHSAPKAQLETQLDEFTRLLRRLAHAVADEQATTVSDFIAARFGNDVVVARLVTVIALLGTIPYVALQLRSIGNAMAIVSGRPVEAGVMVVAALLLALFAGVASAQSRPEPIRPGADQGIANGIDDQGDCQDCRGIGSGQSQDLGIVEQEQRLEREILMLPRQRAQTLEEFGRKGHLPGSALCPRKMRCAVSLRRRVQLGHADATRNCRSGSLAGTILPSWAWIIAPSGAYCKI